VKTLPKQLIFSIFAPVIVFPALVGLGFGTSVVALRTPTAIILGGDTKVTDGNGANGRAKCKVGLTKEVAFGESGILMVPSRGFFAVDIINHALNGDGTLANRVAAFDTAIREPFVRISTELRASNPSGYQTLVKDKVVFSVVFATVEAHVPKLMMLYYIASEEQGEIVLTPKRYNCPGDCDGGIGFVMLGDNDANTADVKAHPTIWKTLGPERAVRHLIEDEIADKPDSVGLPLTIVRLSNGKVAWIEDRNQCKNANKAAQH
jgi:hypothetical protein